MGRQTDVTVHSMAIRTGSRGLRRGMGFAPRSTKAWSWFKKRLRLSRVDIESGLIVRRSPSGELSLARALSRSKLKVVDGIDID